MKAILSLLVSCALASAALAQSNSPTAEMPRASATPSSMETVDAPPVQGTLRGPPIVDPMMNSWCIPTGATDLPVGAQVVVVRKVLCSSQYTPQGPVTLLEVLYKGETVFLRENNVLIAQGAEARLDTLSLSEQATILEAQKAAALASQKSDLESAQRELRNTAAQGIALLEHEIYDVSEYTEATGFSVKLINSGKKTIKYITFNVRGLNAVNDPVYSSSSRGMTGYFKGIGPIEPYEAGSYSYDRMWSTDQVESHRIVSIVVEYMDGSRKTISNVKPLQLSEKAVELLTGK